MISTAEKNLGETYGNFVIVANGGLCLTYFIPQGAPKIIPGTLCFLPLRKGMQSKIVVGVLLEYCEKPNFKCVPIQGIATFEIIFSEEQLSFLRWVSSYYLTSFAKCFDVLAPGFIWNANKYPEILKRFEQLKLKKQKPIKGEMKLAKRISIDLNEEQQIAYEKIRFATLSTSLLYGVTGSGKTEVYLKLALDVISQGKKVLLLVPEIALTPQMTARFRAVFGEQLCVMHSGLTPVEYMQEWLRSYFGMCDIVLGVRTSVFSPLNHIGLIIVDEEHDGSYKCSDMPCYHARDVAVMRATRQGALCVLGSATPSLESFFNAQNGRYQLVTLTQKYSGQTVECHVVDARPEVLVRKSDQKRKVIKSSYIDFSEVVFAQVILEEIEKNKKNGKQSIIMLNRRGYVNYALCATCGTPLTCPHCAVTTTLHQKGEKEICHYCSFTTPTRQSCPECGESKFYLKGAGTQNIEERLIQLMPALRVARFDRDVFTSQSRITKILDDFRLGNIDCLVGTQLLAKGHDFPNVGLVVILHVEDALFLPDFRSAERTFQLITQTMGRAGRGAISGKVYLQSLIPNHPLIENALHLNFEGFSKKEMQKRMMGWLPPLSRQILLEVSHRKIEKAQGCIAKLKEMLIQGWKRDGITPEQVRLAGPFPATISKINQLYRLQICLTAAKNLAPQKVMPFELLQSKEFDIPIKVDVDPIVFL